MKSEQSVFIKVLFALLVVGVLPVTLSSLLIISAYRETTDRTLEQYAKADPDMAEQQFDVIETIEQENTILISMIVGISLILTLFASLFLTRHFTMPLTHVTRAAELIGLGNLAVRLKTPRKDEFGRLAEGFNKMAEALAKAQKELKHANTQLEQRVGERTAELTFMNNELRKTAEKIHEGARLKNEFLSNMSHELRTPLNAILGYTDLLLDGIYGGLTTQQHESLDKIRRNSEMLLRLINDLLDLSRMEAGRMPLQLEHFDAADLVNQTVEVVRPLFDKQGLEVVVEAEPNLPRVHSDKGKIQQVLLNLLSNALKFTEKGSVSIRVEKGEVPNSIVFTVMDTGIGIAPENHAIIFDQFRQVDGSTARKYGGTGLGLSISKKMVSLLDGQISVSSSPNEGSAFKVTLPAVFGKTISETEPAARPVSDHPVVVAIDDDADVLKVITDNLEAEGYSVVGCTDGDRGVRKAKQLLPFAITLDIMMPYRDGWSVLRELKSNPRTRDIPVIIISIIDDRPKGYLLGVDDYIVKPINRRDLLNALQSFDTDRN